MHTETTQVLIVGGGPCGLMLANELDPDFASAYARATSCYAIAKINGWISGTANEIAEVKRLAQRVVELGKDDAFALAAGGWALAYVVRDLEVGAALVDRGLVLNSNLAEAWFYSGWVKFFLSEPELAIERFARAMRPLIAVIAIYRQDGLRSPVGRCRSAPRIRSRRSPHRRRLYHAAHHDGPYDGTCVVIGERAAEILKADPWISSREMAYIGSAA